MLPNTSLEDTEKSYSAEFDSAPFAASKPARSRGSIWRLATIIVVVLAAGGFATWKIHDNLSNALPKGKKGSGGGDRAVPVTATKVESKPMPVYLSAPGTVIPYYSVTIRTRVDGQLMSVNVREGQQVRRGQLLAQVDPSSYEATVAQAEGQLAKDQAAAAYANAAASRYRALFAAGVVSQDREQTQVSAAGQADGVLLADKAAIQAAKVNLAFTRITSPIDGIVGLRQVDPGNIVHASDAAGLFLVAQFHPINLIFTLPEDQLPQVREAMMEGHDLTVEAFDHTDTARLASGKLLTIDNEIDATTGTDKVKAVFQNLDGALFPNQFVNARLILRVIKDALVIPTSAVQTGSQGSFVYVVEKGMPPEDSEAGSKAHGKHGKQPIGESAWSHRESFSSARAEPRGRGSDSKYYVEFRPILISATQGSLAIVQDGLSAGEQIVTDGSERLKNGSVVSLGEGSYHHGAPKGSKADHGSGTPEEDGTAKGKSDPTDAASGSKDTAGGHGKHHRTHPENE